MELDVLRIEEGELGEVLVDGVAQAFRIDLGVRDLEAHLIEIGFSAVDLEAVNIRIDEE